MPNALNTDDNYFSKERGFFTHVVDNRDERYDVHLHSHTFYEFVYIISGSSKHKWQDTVGTVSAGELVIIRPGETHCFVRNKSTICCHRDIIFSKERVLSCAANLRIDFEKGFFSLQTINKAVLSKSQQDILSYYIDFLVNGENGENAFTESTITALLTNLLWNFYKPEEISEKSHKPYFLQYIMSSIDTKSAFNMTMKELSATTFRSHEHVCRAFKKATGKTLSETVRDAKLEYSEKLLRETRMEIKDILDMISVNSHSYFTQSFKNKYGMTPKDYRKEYSLI